MITQKLILEPISEEDEWKLVNGNGDSDVFDNITSLNKQLYNFMK
jgi:hypothetical protein